MRRLALIVAMLVLLCGTAMAGRGTISPGTSGGRGFINGTPAAATGAGGGIGLTNTADWALSAGMQETNGTIEFFRTIDDNFNDNSLSSVFNSDTSGNGVATETATLIVNGLANSDAGIWYYATEISNTITETYIARFIISDLAAGGHQGDVFGLYKRSGAPLLTTAAGQASFRVLHIDVSDSAGLRIFYFDNTSTAQYWNGSAWTTSNSSFGTEQTDVNYKFELVANAASWQTRWFNETADAHITTTDAVNWIATRGLGVDYWIYGGDIYTDINYPQIHWTKFYTLYPTSGTATMGQIPVDVEITNLPIFEANESGCSIVWTYDIGSGFVTPGAGTLAQLKAALIGTTPATLNLKATPAGNSDCKASFYIDNGLITG